MEMKTIVLIMCGNHKCNHRAKVIDLYKSDRYKLSIKYGKLITDENNIFVLSAKHGLLSLNQEIEPYDKSLYKMSPTEKEEWSERVITQLRKYTDANNDRYIFLADDTYCEYLSGKLDNTELPLKGISYEKHIEWLHDHIKEVENGTI
jgi:hypothetical protein